MPLNCSISGQSFLSLADSSAFLKLLRKITGTNEFTRYILMILNSCLDDSILTYENVSL